ncbi:hypothetical protein HDV02_005852 [Globomyces sp. JEL0801]|nr:hypothetical protein HDV02_005852 [Globomyces sp. JEL0801]
MRFIVLLSTLCMVNADVFNIQTSKSIIHQNDPSITHLSTKGLHSNTKWTVIQTHHYPDYQLRIKKDSSLCDPTVKQVSLFSKSKYSGYLDTPNDEHFFFWFFESRSNPSIDPLLLWLNGGPGCSSMIGLLMELGPCRVNSGGNDTTFHPLAWNSNSSLLFLDQPVNVGFSYSNTAKVSTTLQSSEAVYKFLQLFYKAFNEYQHLDFHISGESYAGHYIPSIGRYIYDENQKIKQFQSDAIYIPLSSLAIGNGFTDAAIQYNYYSVFANDTKYGPLLSKKAIHRLEKGMPKCQKLIQLCDQLKIKKLCAAANTYCEDLIARDYSKTGLNNFDVRLPVGDKTYDNMDNDIITWLNKPSVQAQLGVEREYQLCNGKVGKAFGKTGDSVISVMNDLPTLLENGIRVLIYAGDADWICNWIGDKAWTLQMKWNGQLGFNNSTDISWISSITKKPAGEIRKYDTLTFLKVYQSGHFVPLDQPEHSLEFINKWIRNQTIE